MKYLLALGILAVSMLLPGCGRSYNSNSTAYRTRNYPTHSTSSSYRRHQDRGSRRGHGNHDSAHHHHHGDDTDHGKGRR
ncbi:MAG: hypothetical protein ACHP79_06640 [Terriglobales bacterium]